MKKLFLSAICIATALTMVSCGGAKNGPASEVLSKKAFSAVIAKYDNVGDFYDGVAVVSTGWSNLGVIDAKGKEIVECKYYNIHHSCDGMLWFYNDSKFGYFNTKGEVVVEPGKYDDANDFSCGVARVKKNGKYGYINTKGEEVIPLNFDSCRDFSENLALVYANGKYGFIDLKGNFVIAPSYGDAEDFSCGVAIVSKSGTDYVINTKGEIIYTADKNVEFLDFCFVDNLIPVIKKQGRALSTGYINTKGEEAIPFDLQFAMPFEDGVAIVMKDNKVYSINTKGEILKEETSVDIIEEILEEAADYYDFSTSVLKMLLGEDYFD